MNPKHMLIYQSVNACKILGGLEGSDSFNMRRRSGVCLAAAAFKPCGVTKAARVGARGLRATAPRDSNDMPGGRVFACSASCKSCVKVQRCKAHKSSQG